MVEHGSAGGKVAGPIAQAMSLTYLYDRDRAEKTLAPLTAERERKTRAVAEQQARDSAAEAAAAVGGGREPARTRRTRLRPIPASGERGD